MPTIGNPVGGPRYKSKEVKRFERDLATEASLLRLEGRVTELERKMEHVCPDKSET